METISGIKPFVIPNFFHAKNNNGKMSVPVQPYVARNIQFRHIVGIPTTGNANGVPVSKLIAIDNLIDKLISKKTEPAVTDNNIEKNVDQIVTFLEKQFDQIVSGNINSASMGSAVSTASPGRGMGIFLDTWA